MPFYADFYAACSQLTTITIFRSSRRDVVDGIRRRVVLQNTFLLDVFFDIHDSLRHRRRPGGGEVSGRPQRHDGGEEKGLFKGSSSVRRRRRRQGATAEQPTGGGQTAAHVDRRASSDRWRLVGRPPAETRLRRNCPIDGAGRTDFAAADSPAAAAAASEPAAAEPRCPHILLPRPRPRSTARTAPRDCR